MARDRISMLLIYPKNEMDDLTAEQLKQLKNQDDAMKKALFEELLESVKQAKAIERRELKAARVARINPKTDIVKVRAKLGLSQSKFAAILGISADTLQKLGARQEVADGTSEGDIEDCSKASRNTVGSGMIGEELWPVAPRGQ